MNTDVKIDKDNHSFPESPLSQIGIGSFVLFDGKVWVVGPLGSKSGGPLADSRCLIQVGGDSHDRRVEHVSLSEKVRMAPRIDIFWSWNHANFRVGEKVRKRSGYKFPGVVRTIFSNTKGQTRYVVECQAEGAEGVLHIFNQDQLERDSE